MSGTRRSNGALFSQERMNRARRCATFSARIFVAAFVLTFAQIALAGSDDAALDFRLRGIDGRTYDAAKLRGKIVLISFGATWCAPCIAELEALEDLKREYAGEPVEFLWVSIETEEERSDWTLRSFARDNRLTIPVLRDPKRAVYSRFSARTRMPLVVFLDREGKVAGKPHVGMTTPEAYKEIIRRRLNELLNEDIKP
ncbi:MAG: TlpA family protein disulfide reductase [Pyrinomonas methylaliphatogenes]|nr:TlpA family protein disulfide reductase [Pyrinomonas methylaliphatogenes]